MACLLTRMDQGFLFLLLTGVLGIPAVQAQPAALPDTLTSQQATALFLEHNPQLRASQSRARAESQTARSTGLFPNPTLGVSEERTDLPGDGAGDEWYLNLTQPLNDPGEQRARQQSAHAAQQATDGYPHQTLFQQIR